MSLTNQVANVYSSWGRTRQPKNLAGKHEAEIAATVPTSAPSLATDGVSTQNQRYLHIFLKNSTTDAKEVTVWGYTHAFGEWFELKNTAKQAIVLTLAGVVGTKVFEVHEIAGVDRVYFRSTGGNDMVVGDTAMAAGSTFQGS